MPKWLMVTGVALLAGALFLTGITARLTPILQERIIKALQQRFESEVELNRIRVSLFPQFRIRGEDLVFRHKGRRDVPPLISIKNFTIDARLVDLLRTSNHVRRVHLEGLQIHVPPRRNNQNKDYAKRTKPRSFPFSIDEIIADGTLLVILPKKAGKQPLTFEIYRLTLRSVGLGRPMLFWATLTNPKPPGLIQSTGEFGPWQSDEPRQTPVSGSYQFHNADLSVFSGIRGILSSAGNYRGVLERIEVRGATDTPNFAVRISGKPVHLKTRFNAIVDGTDGDTLLQPVNAEFLRSSVLAQGVVTGTAGVKGKTISLDVSLSEARLEDLLQLAVKSDTPPMTGVVSLRTRFELPPGKRDIVDKLKLNGEFGIAAARFTSANVQKKVETLSRRGRGKPKDGGSDRVVSNLKGRFLLQNSVMTFSDLSFGAAGVLVYLNGTYDLNSEELDFRGTLRLRARLSQTTTGIKSFLLKAIDPLFRKKGAGTVLPIKITGMRTHPSYRLDIARALTLRE